MTPNQHDEKDRAVSEDEAQEMREAIKAQGDKIDAMFNALMVPQPGQDRSLLSRMASVTIAIEGGQSVGKIFVWVAGVLAAIGAVYAMFHSQQPH